MTSTLTFPFAVEIDVRGYELDPWQHVNNAVYLSWLEHARWEMSRVVPMETLFGGCMPVVRRAELDYRGQTLFGDRLRITTWPRAVGTTSFVLGQCIQIVNAADSRRVGQVALVAKMVFACWRPDAGKLPVPESFRRYFPSIDPGDEPPPGAIVHG